MLNSTGRGFRGAVCKTAVPFLTCLCAIAPSLKGQDPLQFPRFSEEPKKNSFPNNSCEASICTLSRQMFQPLLVPSLLSYGAHSLVGSFSYVISHFLCLCMFFPQRPRIPAGAPVHTRPPNQPPASSPPKSKTCILA